MFKRHKKITQTETPKVQAPSALEVLAREDIFMKSNEERAELTVKCRDTDYIKKVPDAGKTKKYQDYDIQIMHNGLKVVRGGYFGDWMESIIRDLRGHHEPQEEKLFYEVLKRIGKNATMIELGSFWAYYSLWFNKEIKGATNYCCEPDPGNMQKGKLNAELNDSRQVTFIASAAGDEDGKTIEFDIESEAGRKVSVPIRSIDGLVEEYKIKKIDLLHMDVQGAEGAALKGALKTIRSGKVRFVFVSTHHYVISGNPNLHQECIDFLKSEGAHIISSHTIPESFSGDGLIVASFDRKDKDFVVETSLNHTDDSLFRPYEKDVAILVREYEVLRQKLND